jgi:hypothetical protein
LPALVPLAAGVWWVAGFLPAIVEALGPPRPRVPLATPVVPLVNAPLAGLVYGALTGGVVVGMLGLLAPRSWRARAATSTAAGLAVALAVVLVQAGVSLAYGHADARVAFGLVAATWGAAVAGWLLGACSALGRSGIGVALGVLAAVVPGWLGDLGRVLTDGSAFYTAELTLGPLEEPSWLEWVGRSWTAWVGTGLLVAALVTVGLRPVARLAWWPLAVLVAWFIGPALSAAGNLDAYLLPRPGSATLPDPLTWSWQIFDFSSLPTSRDVVPWLLAIVLAAVAAPFLRWTGSRQPASSRAS